MTTSTPSPSPTATGPESPPNYAMDASFDLADSTDWISTSLPEFEPLEAALRCEVCKEFYESPVITSCNHTFCSKCIRRCISTDGKCPSCRTTCSGDKLIPNIAVREVALRFSEARSKALKMALADKEDAKEEKSKKRKLQDTSIEENGDNENGRNTRLRQTRSRTNHNRGTESRPIQLEIEDSEQGSDQEFLPEDLPEGFSACPICSKTMKTEQVFRHLDNCPGEGASSPGRSSRSKTKPAIPTALQRRQKEPSPPPTRLSQFNYAMLTETALKKKLADLGIPNWGSKDLMKRRHIEWLNIYNSNCDADDSVRKTKKQLLRELDEWETTQGGRADMRENKIMKKDFNGGAYIKSHKSEFDDLIKQARMKRVVPKTDGENKEQEKKDDALEPQTMPESPTKSTDIEMRDSTPNSRQPQFNGTTESHIPNPAHSYENNSSALASIRAKVEQANAQPHPQLTTELSAEMASTRRGSSEGIGNPFTSPSRKVPMFALPEDPVADLDGNLGA